MILYYREALVDVISQHPRETGNMCFRCGVILRTYGEHIANEYEKLFALREVPRGEEKETAVS